MQSINTYAMNSEGINDAISKVGSLVRTHINFAGGRTVVFQYVSLNLKFSMFILFCLGFDSPLCKLCTSPSKPWFPHFYRCQGSFGAAFFCLTSGNFVSKSCRGSLDPWVESRNRNLPHRILSVVGERMINRVIEVGWTRNL